MNDNINILTTMRNNKMLDLLSLKAQNLNDIATNLEKQIKALDYSLAQNKALLEINEYAENEKEDLISGSEVCEDILDIANKALGDDKNDIKNNYYLLNNILSLCNCGLCNIAYIL